MSRSLIALAALFFAADGLAADFTVSNPAEFQTALTAAQSNGENDVINVQPCSGTGCTTVGTTSVYNISSPLTYTAAASENQSLTIDGFDSDTRILDGGGSVSILRIDTTTATSDTSAQIIVRNLTMQNGNAAGTPSDGGALYILVNAARIEVSDSVYQDNAADDDGGAVFARAEGASEFPVRFFYVTFQRNTARGIAGDGTGDGGAVHVAAGAGMIVEVSNSDFFENVAQGNGGGIEIEGNDPLDLVPNIGQAVLFDSYFAENSAGANGGGADIGASLLDLNDIGFVGNTAVDGAGFHLRLNFVGLDIVNSGFALNSASSDGGGFATEPNYGAFVTFTNNTLYANSAANRGGGAFLTIAGSTAFARIYNNIIYNNENAESGRDIFIDNDPFSDIPASVSFFNNDITDLTGFPDASLAFEIVSTTELSSGNNIDDAPLLTAINLTDPDPTQLAASPTIDAGDNDAPGVPNVDFEGDTRPVDGNNDTVATVDIGMDEYVPGALPVADLAVTQTDSPDPVVGGENITYAITVTNNGPDAATGVGLIDTLDPLASFVSATTSQGSGCTSGGTPVVVACILGDIAASGSATATVVVTSPAVEVPTTVTNVVGVAGNEDDSNVGNNIQSVDTTAVAAGVVQADVAVTMTDTPDPVYSGGPELIYTLTVQNNGPDPATGVTLTDTVPIDDVTFVSATVSGTGGSCDPIDGSGVVDCSLGDLAVTSNRTVTIVVQPNEVTSATDITNAATVAASEEDPVPGNNSATATTTVNPPAADMTVSITATPSAPLINEQITYTITVTNDGPSGNTGTSLDVTLPPQATLESVTIDQGSCEVIEGVVTCTIGELLAGDTVNAEIVMTTPGESVVLTMSATVTGDAEDPGGTNNSATDVVTVIDVIDLIIEGSGGSGGGSTGWPAILALLFATAILRLRTARASRCALVVLLGLGVLVAAAPEESRAEGWYAGAAGGQSNASYSGSDLTADLAARGWTINNPETDDTDTAWKIFGGFAFTDFIAVEAGYVDLGEVTTRFGATIPPTAIDDLLSDTFDVHPYLGDGWTAAGVVRFPLGGGAFALTGRAGLFAWQADIEVEVVSGGTGRVAGDDSGTDLFYGVGAEWRVGGQWAITLDWDRYQLDDWVDVPMVGVRVNF